MEESLAGQEEADAEHDRLFVEAFTRVHDLQREMKETFDDFRATTQRNTPVEMSQLKDQIKAVYDQIDTGTSEKVEVLAEKVRVVEAELEAAKSPRAVASSKDGKGNLPVIDLSVIGMLKKKLDAFLNDASGLHGVCSAQGGMIALLEKQNEALQSRLETLEELVADGPDLAEVKERVKTLTNVMGMKVTLIQ